MAIDEEQFKLAMSHFASGVTVVTTEWEGKPYGLTVSSFASLSLHPPLVLVCLEKSVKTHEAIVKAGRFGVSILNARQAEVSARFATRFDDKFIGIEWSKGSTGVPLVANALTTIECRLHQQLPGGDHSIFVGEVVAAAAHEGEPLLYYQSGYRQMR